MACSIAAWRLVAFCVCLDDGVPSLRETAYDVESAAELRASGYPDAESMLAESLLDPVSADEGTAHFESAR